MQTLHNLLDSVLSVLVDRHFFEILIQLYMVAFVELGVDTAALIHPWVQMLLRIISISMLANSMAD